MNDLLKDVDEFRYDDVNLSFIDNLLNGFSPVAPKRRAVDEKPQQGKPRLKKHDRKRRRHNRADAPKIQLMHGDCLKMMKQIPSGSIDMVCVDPPYGTTQCKWDTIVNLEDMWNQLKRIVKPNGAIAVTACQPFTSKLVSSNYKMFKQELIWKKNSASNFLNANRMHMSRHENICIFYQKQPVYNKQYGKGVPYKKNQPMKDDSGACYGKVQKRTTTHRPDGKRNPITVLEFDKPDPKIRLHPTQKPVLLLEYLIKTFTNPGETVLDFTMGSGSTGVAAKQLGRAFIGIELDQKFYAIATDRIAKTTTPTPH